MNTPHSYRRQSIHSWFIILFGIIAAMIFFMATSCRPSKGCYGTKGMSGYGWIKNKKINKTFILNKEGAIVCTYTDI